MSDAGTFGYGQLRPEDYAADANAVAFIVRQMISQIVTVKVVKVIAVHPGSGTPPVAGTVDVQPLVSQIDGNGYAVAHGTVFGLQYFRLQAGPWAIIADPAVDDIGVIVCADRDSSNVTSAGTPMTPRSRRRFNIADGIYFGGNLNVIPKAFLQLNADGTFDLKDQNGTELKSTSQGLTITGNVTVNGTVTATDFSDGRTTSYKVHTHTGVTTGAGITGTPTPGS